MADSLLNIAGLKTHFDTRRGTIRAVDGLDLSVSAGEAVGVVGESGSGKSVMAASILGLVPKPGQILEGSILFDGVDLTKAGRREMSRIRGKRISLITQDPLASLDPVFTVGYQVDETIRQHLNLSRRSARSKTVDLLKSVRLSDAEGRVNGYPHQMSGGMLQRVVAAISISCEPSLIIADEPTSALDVTIQSQFLALLEEIRIQHNTAIIIITHDFGVVARSCDRVAVMYAGRVVESGSTAEVLQESAHPYTMALLNSIPSLTVKQSKLVPIPGSPPDGVERLLGCPFAPRCVAARASCWRESPPDLAVTASRRHRARCWAIRDPAWATEARRAYGRTSA